LGAAVKVINTLPTPDFSGDTIGRQVGNEVFTTYAMYKVPGVRLENVFRELGGRDFEATLAQANQLGDMYLRASAVLALAAKCLENAARQEQPERPKRPARGAKKQ
jgi:hypothetical protein